MANTMTTPAQTTLSSSLSSTPSTLDPNKRWVVGAAILSFPPSLSPSSSSTTPPSSTAVHKIAKPVELLLIRRSDSEPQYPGYWEIPGGHVEASDKDLEDAIRREVREETDLTIHSFLSRLPDMTWRSARHENVQVSWLVTASHHQDTSSGERKTGRDKEGEEAQVTLNPEEHSSYMWAEEGDVEGLYMTDEMRKVVRDAFRAARRLSGSSDGFVVSARSVGG